MKPATCIFLIAISMFSVSAQIAVGGPFSMDKAVIANGGGSAGSGSFGVTGTTGQNAAGNTAQNPVFSQPAGFWVRDNFVPTAAMVTVSGRVTTAGGNGIRNARVTLTDSVSGERVTTTASLGFFVFNEVEVGRAYVVTVDAKRYRFSTPSVLLNVTEDMTSVDFTANQ